jgi:hypothetical protein
MACSIFITVNVFEEYFSLHNTCIKPQCVDVQLFGILIWGPPGSPTAQLVRRPISPTTHECKRHTKSH